MGRPLAEALVALIILPSCASMPPPAAAAPQPTVAPAIADAPAAPPSPPPPSAPASPQPPSLGHIVFPVTGSAECQRLFLDGMLALHSFEYDAAHESFAAALAADPSCAMAAWGDAMSYDHAIWSERDLSRARAALARVTREDALTPKERAYLATARILFDENDLTAAHRAWLAAAAKMHEDYPDDDEPALQHALALLSVYGYDPAHVREQMEAGAIALDVARHAPDHPGAAHYAIHAFDSRDHAILALPLARVYARIAPAAGHALHMPSHTFAHLGMYKDVVASNERAYAASVAWASSHGKSPSQYDWHSYSWLVAALLETGRPARARALVDDARALLVAAKDDSSALRFAYAHMVVDYVTQSDQWQDVEALAAPVLAPAIDEGGAAPVLPPGTHGGSVAMAGPVACAAHAPGGGGAERGPDVLTARLMIQALRAEAAVHAGDVATARARVRDMGVLERQMAPWAKVLRPSVGAYLTALGDEIAARADARASHSAAADKKARAAIAVTIEREEAGPSSGPVFGLTARERLAQTLAGAGQPREALAQWERDLDAHPGRAIALLGAARAAQASGDSATARAFYTDLAGEWSDADGEVPALAEVHAAAR